MSNRLSFSQILQKKQATGQHPDIMNMSRISSKAPTVANSSFPSLLQCIDQFVNFPNEEFTLSFRDEQASCVDSQYGCEDSQEFESGINPLDSWVMSQTKTKEQQNKINSRRNQGNKKTNNSSRVAPELQKFLPSQSTNKSSQLANMKKEIKINAKDAQHNGFGNKLSMKDLAKQLINGSKENNGNWTNENDEDYEEEEGNYHGGKPTYPVRHQTARNAPAIQSMKSSTSSQPFEYNDSKKFGPTQPGAYANTRAKNKEMFVDEKFIQSQAYQNPLQYSNNNKMERSEQVQPQKNTDKVSLLKAAMRYKNQPDTERSEPTNDQQQPPQEQQKTNKLFEKKKVVPAVSGKQKVQACLDADEEENFTKREKEAADPILKYVSDKDDRIQNAKKQISELLQKGNSAIAKPKISFSSNTVQDKKPAKYTIGKTIPTHQEDRIEPETKNNHERLNQYLPQSQPHPQESFNNLPSNYSFSSCIQRQQTSGLEQNSKQSSNCIQSSTSSQKQAQMPESPKTYHYLDKKIATHQKEKQNEQMLACIMYACSEVDASEGNNRKSLAIESSIDNNEDAQGCLKFINNEGLEDDEQSMLVSGSSVREIQDSPQQPQSEPGHKTQEDEEIRQRLEEMNRNNELTVDRYVLPHHTSFVPTSSDNSDRKQDSSEGELGLVSNLELNKTESVGSRVYDFKPLAGFQATKFEKKQSHQEAATSSIKLLQPVDCHPEMKEQEPEDVFIEGEDTTTNMIVAEIWRKTAGQQFEGAASIEKYQEEYSSIEVKIDEGYSHEKSIINSESRESFIIIDDSSEFELKGRQSETETPQHKPSCFDKEQDVREDQEEKQKDEKLNEVDPIIEPVVAEIKHQEVGFTMSPQTRELLNSLKEEFIAKPDKKEEFKQTFELINIEIHQEEPTKNVEQEPLVTPVHASKKMELADGQITGSIDYDMKEEPLFAPRRHTSSEKEEQTQRQQQDGEQLNNSTHSLAESLTLIHAFTTTEAPEVSEQTETANICIQEQGANTICQRQLSPVNETIAVVEPVMSVQQEIVVQSVKEQVIEIGEDKVDEEKCLVKHSIAQSLQIPVAMEAQTQVMKSYQDMKPMQRSFERISFPQEVKPAESMYVTIEKTEPQISEYLQTATVTEPTKTVEITQQQQQIEPIQKPIQEQPPTIITAIVIPQKTVYKQKVRFQIDEPSSETKQQNPQPQSPSPSPSLSPSPNQSLSTETFRKPIIKETSIIPSPVKKPEPAVGASLRSSLRKSMNEEFEFDMDF